MARTARERTRPIRAIRHHPGDQETVDAAHVNRCPAAADHATRRIIDLLPLSPDQRSRLAILLPERRLGATSSVAARKTPTEDGARSRLRERNQVFGFVLALIAFGGAIVLTLLGMPDVGAMFLSTSVIALIFAFVVRR